MCVRQIPTRTMTPPLDFVAHRRLDAVIHFRVPAAKKERLEELAVANEVSVGEVCRKALEVAELLFDPNLRFSDLLKSTAELRQIQAART